ncbi:MAG: YbbR-like domain-containing protein [Prevotella sp.]|nr:YbbR-like domain-containing protein [Prevotella sp.]MCI6403658.1 YbbR-like domain-containing protein [Prevotella sp.]MCI6510925.1 YbbR-like domain-containing protein [Prevotella sp.]MCI7269269.1 YbbR-like domain-containing protein [Prevotella sp.]MCI7452307.1 YbbR-like domain-containing protein [Prevotella sp.]
MEWKNANMAIKDFFFMFVNKEFLIFLFFLAVSAGFWCMISLNETYEKEVCVPLQLVGVPDNVVITDPLPDTVKVVLKDKGYTLMSYLYGDAIRPVVVSFNNCSKKNDRGSITQGDFIKLLYAKLFGNTKIVSVKAEKWDFTFNYGLAKMVPVVIEGEIKAYDDYYIARTEISPEIVKIYSSKEKLDSIEEVFTDQLNLTNFKDTVSRTITIKKMPGVKVEPSQVKVKFYADKMIETEIMAPVKAINMPENLLFRPFPARVPIRVVVGKANFQSLNPDDFIVETDYKELPSNPDEKCNLTLRSVPRYVISASLNVKQVEYLVETVE